MSLLLLATPMPSRGFALAFLSAGAASSSTADARRFFDDRCGSAGSATVATVGLSSGMMIGESALPAVGTGDSAATTGAGVAASIAARLRVGTAGRRLRRYARIQIDSRAVGTSESNAHCAPTVGRSALGPAVAMVSSAAAPTRLRSSALPFCAQARVRTDGAASVWSTKSQAEGRSASMTVPSCGVAASRR